MNTYESITTLTHAMVEARIEAADARVRKAAKDMSERQYRRAESGPNWLSDAPHQDAPMCPPIPEAVMAILTSGTVERLPHWQKSENRTQPFGPVHRDGLVSRVTYHGSPQSFVDSSATPQAIVAAIKAADDYAAEYERLASEYAETVRRTNAEHVQAQADACRELVGLCGSEGGKLQAAK